MLLSMVIVLDFRLLIINDHFMANVMGVSVAGYRPFRSDILHTITYGVHNVSDGKSHGCTEILREARWEGPQDAMGDPPRSRGT